MSDAPLPAGCSISRFVESDSVTEDDVLELWARESVLEVEEARRRLGEVFMVAVDDAVGLVGVMTVFVETVDQLRLDMWITRVLVAESHRRSNVSRRLFYAAVADLEARYVSGEDTRAAGTLSVFENPGLRIRYTTAVTPSGNTFIGESSEGAPMFIRYFRGATVSGPRP